MSVGHQQFLSPLWNPCGSSCPLLAAQFLVIPMSNRELSPVQCSTIAAAKSTASFSNSGDLSADFGERNNAVAEATVSNGKAAKGSGTTARGRRLLKVREEKRKREYERLHNYPAWAKVLEDACKHDTELRAVLGDSIGNPELMRKRIEDRVRTKGRSFQKSKTGSVLAFKVSFRE